MKLQLLLLCGFFVAATSFTTHSSEPVKPNNTDTSKVKRCGPWFDITNVSNATVGSTYLTNGGTVTFTWAAPTFPISIPQQSGTSWTFHTRITAGSNTAVIIKDHGTGATIACDAARPGEIIDIPFFSGCSVIDIIYTNDLTLCGL